MKEIIFPDKYADKETLTYDENLTCSDKTTRLKKKHLVRGLSSRIVNRHFEKKKKTSFVDSVVELSTTISKRVAKFGFCDYTKYPYAFNLQLMPKILEKYNQKLTSPKYTKTNLLIGKCLHITRWNNIH